MVEQPIIVWLSTSALIDVAVAGVLCWHLVSSYSFPLFGLKVEQTGRIKIVQGSLRQMISSLA